MPEETSQKIKYCSVDLELTGFDPSQEEILEVGLAFFEVTNNSLVITEKYSQVFKPRNEVHPKILGLTGISQSELDEAPLFVDHRDVIQEKLRGAVIVGHSVSVDIAFLRAFGIECGDVYIDTLELAQFILPTHHSYNLENLMHSVGVTHVGAHRALADCLATLTVLERLLGIYQGFPKIVHEEISKLVLRTNFSWSFLLNLPFPVVTLSDHPKKVLDESHGPLDLAGIQGHSVTSFGLSVNLERPLEISEGEVLLALPHKTEVVSFWENGLASGVFEAKDYFSKEKFESFLVRPDLSYDEIRFAIKVIVWLYTNWQTQTILDLNLSFFGGQFKSFITAEERPALPQDKIVACDHSTLIELVNSGHYLNRKIIVWDIGLFEQTISSRGGMKASWNFVLYLLKSIYNPETNFGDQKLKDEVVELLTATDLFFGLVSMLLEPKLVNTYIVWKELANDDYLINRIKSAAENYTAKINQFTTKAEFSELESFSKSLKSFFEEDPSLVKWIELKEGYCAFHSQPLSIQKIVQPLLDPNWDLAFIDTTNNPNIVGYYKTRFNLTDDWTNTPAKSVEQSKPVPVTVNTKDLSDSQLLEHLTNAVKLPVVVIFKDVPAIKDFYKQYYLKLKEKAAVYAQGYSGGLNKLLRNFGIKEHSMLLATAQFLGQQHSAKIYPKTVVVNSLPHQSTEHPYLKAQIEAWQANPLAHQLGDIFDLILFHRLIERVYNEELLALELFASEPDSALLNLALEHLKLLGNFELS